MNGNQQLISRWDTAPHHKNLRNFPYHVHLPDGVKESKKVTLLNVLDEIEGIVAGQLEDE